VKGTNKLNARRRLLSRSALAALGATALTVGVAGHVSAAPLVATQSYFAGYAEAPTDGIASASATFKVPAISCSDDNDYAQQLGVNVDNSLYAAIEAGCNGSGSASYNFFLEEGGGTPFTPTGVSAGDTVVTVVFQTTSTQEADVEDLTTGARWYDYGPNTGTLSDAFIGGFNVGDTPPFGTVSFTKCQINGLYLDAESPTQYNQKIGGTTLVTASAIGKPGDTFKLTFKHEA